MTIITKQGYVDVTYIDKSKTIYSKNMCLWNRCIKGIFPIIIPVKCIFKITFARLKLHYF